MTIQSNTIKINQSIKLILIIVILLIFEFNFKILSRLFKQTVSFLLIINCIQCNLSIR